MPTFSYDTLETLDFDFTEIPRENPTKTKKFCSGKGTIPEPTKDRLMTYGEAVNTLFATDAEQEIAFANRLDQAKTEEDIQAIADEQKAAHQASRDRFISLTAALCDNTPTVAQLKELPPRALNAFLTWVRKEIADPEV